jgi:hypothetical protein
LGATLFDLTATNIVGKYPGKSGLNMLLHLVIKVSRFGYDLEQLLKQLIYQLLPRDGLLLFLKNPIKIKL